MENMLKTFWKKLWCPHDWVFSRAYVVRGADNYYDHFPEVGEMSNMVVHEYKCTTCGKLKEV